MREKSCISKTIPSSSISRRGMQQQSSKKSILKLKRRLRRSKRLEKNIRFEQDEIYKKQFGRKTMRLLFSNRILEELPNEMLSHILSFLKAEELMTVRCINKHFLNLVDTNTSIWSKVSFQNLWPTSPAEKDLFRRGVDASNAESLIKLSLAHLYHYNLTASAEKSEQDVKTNAAYAANYFRHLDNTISPHKPLTWMLIRPPWSHAKPYCLKSAIYKQIMEKSSSCEATSLFNIGKILTIETAYENQINPDALTNLKRSSGYGCTHATFEELMLTKYRPDKGSRLCWFRDILHCSSKGNKDATFEVCKFLIINEEENYLNKQEAQHLCRNLFKNCSPSGIDRLEQIQPKVNEAMRCILIDWLAEVAYIKFMSQQVLHAAVHYIDRYLKVRTIERPKLQLLGITCLLIAAKCHDDPRQVHILTVREASWLSDQTYQYEDVVMMMGEVIGAFNGDIWCPTSYNYLNLLLTFPELSEDVKVMCQYVHDVSLQYTCFGSVNASVVAASVVYLSNVMLKKGNPWPTRMSEYTGISIKDIVNTAALIHHKGFSCPPMRDDRDLPLDSIKTRYLSDDMSCVAETNIPTEAEMKYLFIASDENLSCISSSPLIFSVVSDMDDTLNVSTKSIDYYGDCEDDNMNSSFEDDDESFYVGRNRAMSFQSPVEDYSDDETTMDGEGVSFSHMFRLADQRRDNFTPIFQTSSGASNELRKINEPETSFQFNFSQNNNDDVREVKDNHFIGTIDKSPLVENNGISTSSSAFSRQERRSKRKCVLSNNGSYFNKRSKSSDPL